MRSRDRLLVFLFKNERPELTKTWLIKLQYLTILSQNIFPLLVAPNSQSPEFAVIITRFFFILE